MAAAIRRDERQAIQLTSIVVSGSSQNAGRHRLAIRPHSSQTSAVTCHRYQPHIQGTAVMTDRQTRSHQIDKTTRGHG